MKFTVIDLKTGQILRYGNCHEIDFESQAGNQELVVEGNFDDTTHYWDGSQVLAMPQKPEGHHKFNFVTKKWEFDVDFAAQEIKDKRNKLLADSDWTDTLSAKARLGSVLYEQWQIYRQELRDITKQKGFPQSVDFPKIPQ